ncbi:hypothetical protein DL96DRAFT_775083 [Flagelloscypha sp. PMI_526]|nr:hypothetical protein DL96DRAFT_775083 [Flagelloscypha sp. PMI_526]
MILGFTSFLASMLVIGASPFLEPRVEPGPDLSMKPSVNNKIKLYRAITNPAEQLLIRSQIGRSPTWMSMGKGDFSPDGFPTLYFFDEPKNAAFWCQSSSKDFCVVATLEWSPPVGVRVKRWTVANSEWHEVRFTNVRSTFHHALFKFLVYNWNGLNGGMLSHWAKLRLVRRSNVHAAWRQCI